MPIASFPLSVFCSLVAGLAAAFYILGPHTIDPRNIGWLHEDPATHYLGWAFFRQSESWHFPLTWTDRLGYPWGVSISFLDSIPLLALAARPFSPFLSEPFQFLGLFSLLCFTLQAYFGAQLARAVGIAHPIAVGVSALFFLLAPPFIFRMNGHFALASHWLILICLTYYLRTPSPNHLARWIAPQVTVLCIAGSINPYMFVMCLMVVFAAAARLWLAGLVGVRGFATMCCVAVVAGAASLVLCGFLIGGEASQYAGARYRFFSLNLLAIFDPMYGGLLYDSLPTATQGQYEGYNYLGLGLLVLLCVGVAHRLRRASVQKWRLNTAQWRKALPLVAVGVVSSLLAISATITLGSITLVDIPLPLVIENLAATMRASGRLFWPAYYLLFVLAFISVRSLRSPLREAVLVLALVIQILDISPMVHGVRGTRHLAGEAPLKSPVWTTLGRSHDHLVVHPAWQCGLQTTPGGLKSGFYVFGLLAAEQGMTLNSYYAGRTSKKEFRNHCEIALEPVAAGRLDARSAYVLSAELAVKLASSGQDTHRCSLADGFYLCVHDSLNPGFEVPLPAVSPAFID